MRTGGFPRPSPYRANLCKGFLRQVLVTHRPCGLIMLAMTDLALAGAKPNSSFGDPSYPFSRGAVPAPTRKPPIAHSRRTNSQVPSAQKNPRSECLTTGVTRLACSQEAVAPYVRKIASAIGKKTWCALRRKRASVHYCASASAQKIPAIAGRATRIHRALRGTKRPSTLAAARAAGNTNALPAITDCGLSRRRPAFGIGRWLPARRATPRNRFGWRTISPPTPHVKK